MLDRCCRGSDPDDGQTVQGREASRSVGVENCNDATAELSLLGDAADRHRRRSMALTTHQLDPKVQDLVNFKDFIPSWGYDEEVGEAAEELALEKKMIRMQACVGPAIFWAALAIAVFWPIYIALTVFGIVSAKCTTEHEHYRIKAIYSVIVLFRFMVEFKCLRYVTIPYVQTLERFQWVSVTIPFPCWLIITGTLSFTNLMDMMTDSLFVTSARENTACLREAETDPSVASSTQQKVDLLWKDLFQDWPILPQVHYAEISILIWLVTVSQMIYPILQCTPRPGVKHDIDTAVGSDKTKYKNLLGQERNFGDVLYLLADGTGMATLAVQQPEYPRMRERLRRQQHQEDFNPERALGFVEAALREGMISVGLVGTLENMPQVLLQSFVFKLTKAVGGGQHQAFLRQTIVSISFSVVMCIAKIWKSCVLLRFAVEVRGAIRDRQGGFDAISSEALRIYKDVVRFSVVLIVMALLMIVGVLKALLQIVSTDWCDDNQMWQIFEGCVCLSKIVENNELFDSTCTLKA